MTIKIGEVITYLEVHPLGKPYDSLISRGKSKKLRYIYMVTIKFNLL